MTSLGATVLNVDDDEAARYAKSRWLRHAGFAVIDAGTGAEALQKMEAQRPALVLLDVRLPDMSGIDVCREIKLRWPATMVLQTSATFMSPGDRVRGLEGGADSYLIQPIDASELVAAVRALLRLHKAEERTRLLNEHLEKRIEERTRELTEANQRLIEQIAQRQRAEAALVQSQKMEAVGQLTGSMAHDFNNILASMVGYIHVIRLKSSAPDIRAMLDKTLAAADRGKRLTMRLLSFSRGDDLVTGPTGVCSLVRSMDEWLRQTVGSGIALELATPEQELVALTDGNQLELAILNLVINARDAMPHGGRITIEVAAAEHAGAGDDLARGRYVVVSVTDTGTGMAPEVAAHAFDPFFTTKPAGRGTGLGLAQVANVSRLSSGTARMISTEGVGTRVELWLAAGRAADLPAAEEEAAPRGRGERILVVDDESDIVRSLEQLLQQQGYAVECASSGPQALTCVEARTPDLVLLDFAMPGMSGLDVALRAREQHPGLPIVFVSGHAERDELEASLPGVCLLRKPFQSEELFRTIAACLAADR